MSLIFATIPQKRLIQGITSSSSVFYINNILSFDGINDITSSDLGTKHYCCFRNDTGTVIELMEIDPTTISTGPITIVRRGLSFYGDLTTENADLKLDWGSNSIVMFGSDVPQIFQWLKEYIDAASIVGAVPASPTALGIARLNKIADDTDIPYVVGSNDIVSYAADSVGSDSYAITPSPAITAYSAGQMFRFKAGTANTGACTLNVSGLGAKTIKKNVSDDLITGDILANQIVTVIYDGINMQLISNLPTQIPITRTYTGTLSANKGSSTTTFDITEPVADTMRYTYDGTGTDPVISAATFLVGTYVQIYSQGFTAANNGTFLITASGTHYFEVTNASGVAEDNVNLYNSDYILKTFTFTTTWTKPTGLKYAVVEVQAGGGCGGTAGNEFTGGGGGGGYSKKIISNSTLGSTESLIIGVGGHAFFTGTNPSSGLSSFGSHCSATGGVNGTSNGGGEGGIGSNGDINIKGQGGSGSGSGATGSGSSNAVGSGNGGSSHLGGGGKGGDGDSGGTDADGGQYGGGGAGAADADNGGTVIGGSGAAGIIIVTEHY